MRKALAAAAALTLSLALFGCGSSLSLELVDGNGTITADSSASGEVSAEFSMGNGAITFISGLESGTVTVSVQDVNSTPVFEAEITPQSTYPVETRVDAGDYTLVAAASDATGTVVITYGDAGTATGMPNPWSGADSAQTAAQIAGLDSFTVPETIELAGQTFENPNFTAMDGMAECRLNGPSAQLTIRKGTQTEEPDISGDYNTYAAEWTQTVGEHKVTCKGAEEGAAANIIWSSDFHSFSIVLTPMEDLSAGLTADEVAAVVSAVQ